MRLPAKAVEADGGFHVQAGGPIFTPTRAFVSLAENLPFAHAPEYERWQAEAGTYLEGSGAKVAGRKVAPRPKATAEVVASGAYVSASKSFNRFLREHRNREIKCIEMEASGLMNTIHQFAELKSVVLRGISDHADDDKAALEAESGDLFRRYAMRNAVTFFITLAAVPDFWAE